MSRHSTGRRSPSLLSVGATAKIKRKHTKSRWAGVSRRSTKSFSNWLRTLFVNKKEVRTNLEKKINHANELSARLKLLKFYIEHNKASSKYSLTKLLPPSAMKSHKQTQNSSESEHQFKLPIIVIELANEPTRIGGVKSPKLELLVKRVHRDITLFGSREEDCLQ